MTSTAPIAAGSRRPADAPSEATEAAPPRRSRRRGLLVEWLPLTAFYLALGIFLTWPLVKRMSSGIYGFGNDNFGGMFVVEWINRAFWGPEKLDFAPELQYPFGFEIDERFISPWDRIFSILFGNLGDGLFAYNLEVLTSFMFAGLTMYALARYLTGSRPAAFVAGTIFAASPFHLAMSMQYPAMASIQFAPLVVLALIHAFRTRRKRDAALLGVAVSGMWVASYYYGWFTIWWVGAMGVAFGLVGLVRAIRAKNVGPAVADGLRFAVTRGAIAVGTTIAITLPMVWSLVKSVLSEPEKYERESQDLIQNAVRPWQFVLPPQDHPVWGDKTADVINRHGGILPVYEQNVYLGVVPVVLALVGFVLYRNARAVARGAMIPLVAASCFFALLMFGSHIPYEVWSIGDWMSPNTNPSWTGPVTILYDISPNFRYYGRAFVFISVALAALAAVGLALALRRLPTTSRRWVPWAIASVVAGLVVFEFVNRPPNRFVDLTEPAWVNAVQELPDDASIVNYPVADYSTPRSLFYTLWQTKHDHATANPPETPESQAFLRSVDDPDSFLSGQELHEKGIDYAVVHTKLPPATFPPYQPAFQDDAMAPDAGSRNPWFRRAFATEDAVFYEVLDRPRKIGGAVVGYSSGWGEPEVESGARWRWMRNGDSELTAFAARTYERATLEFAVTSFYQPRDFKLFLDGRLIHRMKVPPDSAPEVRVPIRLTKGSHELQIATEPGVQEIDSVLHNGDLRAVSVRIRQPRIILPGQK